MMEYREGNEFNETVADGKVFVRTFSRYDELCLRTVGEVVLTPKQANALKNYISAWLTRFAEVDK